MYQNLKVIAAAGDRHLVEFLPHAWYLKDDTLTRKYKFHFTPVSLRKEIMESGNETAIRIKEGIEEVSINSSGEEGIDQIKALLGLKELITNVNMPNYGQIPNLPIGHVVETNALFRYDNVSPIMSFDIPLLPKALTVKHIVNHQLLLKAFHQKDLVYARQALHLDVVTSHLNPSHIDDMFDEIIESISGYLTWYDRGVTNE